MAIDRALPVRRGHFRLESGYHTDVWITLDALFTDLPRIAPHVDRLAELLRPSEVTAVCGPFVGGVFLALLLAQRLNARFFYTQLRQTNERSGLFSAVYELTPELRREIDGARVAVVDDMISAGSSVRATVDAVQAARATVAVVGCLTVLGTKAKEYFASVRLPLVSVDAQPLALWNPSECPMCAAKVPLETPR